MLLQPETDGGSRGGMAGIFRVRIFHIPPGHAFPTEPGGGGKQDGRHGTADFCGSFQVPDPGSGRAGVSSLEP